MHARARSRARNKLVRCCSVLTRHKTCKQRLPRPRHTTGVGAGVVLGLDEHIRASTPVSRVCRGGATTRGGTLRERHTINPVNSTATKSPSLRSGPASTELSPDSAELGPIATKSEPTLNNLEPISAKPGPNRAKFGPTSGRFGTLPSQVWWIFFGPLGCRIWSVSDQ